MNPARDPDATDRDAADLDDDFGFAEPATDQSFENALAKARDGDRLSIDDATELLATGTDTEGSTPSAKSGSSNSPTAGAMRRSATITFVANLNNNVTTACNTGCLFCNFKDSAHAFGPTATPTTLASRRRARRVPRDRRRRPRHGRLRGVLGVRAPPALALNEEHHEILQSYDDPESEVNYKPPEEYATDPGTYVEQIEAMSVGGIHLHSMTPEEAYHAARGDWGLRDGLPRTRCGRTRLRSRHRRGRSSSTRSAT